MAVGVKSVHEQDICRAIRNIQSPNGSSFNDLRKYLLPSAEADPYLQRSFRLALARGIRSGSIDQDVKSLRYRLTNPLAKQDGSVMAKSASSDSKRKPYCSKNIKKGCRRRYMCNRRRGNLPYCSKYQTRCCRRRKKTKSAPRKKPKKAKCAKKKPKKPKKAKCAKKKPKKPKCAKKKKPKKPKCAPKPKPKPKC